MNKIKKEFFDRNNFYSENNARIIENLLDNSKGITINQIYRLKLITEKEKIKIFEYLKNKIEESKKSREIGIYNNHKLYFINEDNEKNFSLETYLKPDVLLSHLAKNGFIKKELYRLPRLSKEKINFDINPDYYQEYENLNSEDIIKSEKNYINIKPLTLTYQELKERWEKKEIIEDYIRVYIEKKLLGAYLTVEPSDVISSDNTSSNYTLNSMRKMNCGNPYYLKRYKNLEKLRLNAESQCYPDKPINPQDKNFTFDFLVSGKNITIITKKEKYNFLTNNGIFHYFQTTDIETKFHITRKLKYFYRKNKTTGKIEEVTEISITDLVFLKEEAEAIEKKININKKSKEINQEVEEEQLLGRSAIKAIYKKITGHAWDKHFLREKNNGLIKIKTKTLGTKNKYKQKELHKWLIENNYYTIETLTEIKKNTDQAVQIVIKKI